MFQRAAVSTLLCVCFTASIAAAHPIRQIGPITAQGAPAPTLQQILDHLVVSGPPIDASAPSSADLFTNSAAPMTVQLVVDYTHKQGVKFGMYDPDNVDNPAFILPNGITPAKIATVSFNEDDSIEVSGGFHKTYTGFEGPFGFFIKTFDEKAKKHGTRGGTDTSQFFYTQDALNPGGSARAVVFQGDGHTVIQLPGMRAGVFLPSQFLIAWETGADGKFNDYMVLVSNIIPSEVPEPSMVLLLGISSLALLRGRRARSALK